MVGVLLVFLGGGAGSVLRYLVAAWMTPDEWAGQGPRFPWATLAVNLVGCVGIGLLAGYCGKREWARMLLMIGLLGGFTTFSTFGLDAVRLTAGGHWGRAVWYVGLSVACGLLGAWLALRIAGIDEAGLLGPTAPVGGVGAPGGGSAG